MLVQKTKTVIKWLSSGNDISWSITEYKHPDDAMELCRWIRDLPYWERHTVNFQNKYMFFTGGRGSESRLGWIRGFLTALDINGELLKKFFHDKRTNELNLDDVGFIVRNEQIIVADAGAEIEVN